MALNPADLQNLIPKATEVGRAQEVQDRRSQADLQQAAARFSEQVELRTRHVPDAPKARGGRVERDRKDQAPGQKGRPDRRPKERSGRPPRSAAGRAPAGEGPRAQGPAGPGPNGVGGRVDVKV